MAKHDARTVTQTTAREAIQWVRTLSKTLGCAGPPACEPITVDVATGKREGGLCVCCEALEWLERRRLLKAEE
jgi:hypothetical protein